MDVEERFADAEDRNPLVKKYDQVLSPNTKWHEHIPSCCSNLPCLPSPLPPFFYDHGGARFVLCVNPASGSNQGTELADWFGSRFVEEVAIVRLGSTNDSTKTTALVEKLKLWNFQSSVSEIRLIVAGGDGTVSWALSTMEEMLANTGISVPPMVLFPLGTGNELSRCLGWGDGSSNNSSISTIPSICGNTKRLSAPRPVIERIIESAVQAKVETVDRWVVDGWESANIEEEPNFIRPMLCFCSIGFDADISHQFSIWRKACPQLFSSMLVNKTGYAYLGVKTLLSPPPSIMGRVTLEIDGVSIPLPSKLRSVQVFNCHGSSDGVDFFGCGQPSVEGELQKYSHPSNDDGLLEVVGTEGVPHLLSAKLGFRHSWRLGQGKTIKLTILKPSSSLVAQVDGESWVAKSGALQINHVGKVNVIVGPNGRFPLKM
jgi:diacylglycerol kinase (ATP)